MIERSFHAGRHAILMIVGVVTFLSSPGSMNATTIDEVIAPVREPGVACEPIDGEHGWSPQARTMYSMNLADTHDGTSTQPLDKRFESFVCDKQKLTVYMYRYATEAQARSALKGAKLLVWGGNSRNYHHPERIVTVDEVLVVVSGSKPKHLAQVIMKGQTRGGEK